MDDAYRQLGLGAYRSIIAGTIFSCSFLPVLALVIASCYLRREKRNGPKSNASWSELVLRSVYHVSLVLRCKL